MVIVKHKKRVNALVDRLERRNKREVIAPKEYADTKSHKLAINSALNSIESLGNLKSKMKTIKLKSNYETHFAHLD